MYRKILNRTIYRSRLRLSDFNDYSEYVKIQHRCEPKEFIDDRLKIASSLAFILPILDELKISDPVYHKEADLRGQLIENRISILDVGTRNGYCVQLLNDLGYRNALGAEMHGDYVEYCRGRNRNVVFGDVHDLGFKDNAFNLVYCRHVIEHTLYPVKALNELMRVTRDALYCSFPLEGATCGKHTTAFPNLRSVNKVLAALDHGFDPIYVGRARKTSVIPQGDEVIIFIRKSQAI